MSSSEVELRLMRNSCASVIGIHFIITIHLEKKCERTDGQMLANSKYLFLFLPNEKSNFLLNISKSAREEYKPRLPAPSCQISDCYREDDGIRSVIINIHKYSLHSILL